MFEQQLDFDSGVAKTLSFTTQRRYQRLWGKKTSILNVEKHTSKVDGKNQLTCEI